MSGRIDPAGDLLRQWRNRRRLSQLALAVDAGISQRHLSFMESGRSRPSRDMVIHLAECLDVPLRERNVLLVAAGHAPHYPQHSLAAPALAGAREMIGRIIDGHMPHPALAVSRHWTLLSANAAVRALLAGVASELLEGEVNVLRLSLHPRGLAPRILNLAEWHAHVIARLEHEVERTADPVLAALRDELKAYPTTHRGGSKRAHRAAEDRIAVPLQLESDAGTLSFLSTTTVFGTAVDVTLSEVTVETFFPADHDTSRRMERLLAHT